MKVEASAAQGPQQQQQRAAALAQEQLQARLEAAAAALLPPASSDQSSLVQPGQGAAAVTLSRDTLEQLLPGLHSAVNSLLSQAASQQILGSGAHIVQPHLSGSAVSAGASPRTTDGLSLLQAQLPQQQAISQHRAVSPLQQRPGSSVAAGSPAMAERPRFATQVEPALHLQQQLQQEQGVGQVDGVDSAAAVHVRGATESAAGHAASEPVSRPCFATQAQGQGQIDLHQFVLEAQEQTRLQQELQYMSPNPVQGRGAAASAAGPVPSDARPRFATQVIGQSEAGAQRIVLQAQEEARLQQELQNVSLGPVQGRDAAISAAGLGPAGRRPRFATQALGASEAAEHLVQQARLQLELQHMSPGPVQGRDASVSAAGPAPAGNRPRFATEAAHQDLAAAQQMVHEAQEQARLQQELQYVSSGPVQGRDAATSAAGPAPVGNRPRFATEAAHQDLAAAQQMLLEAQQQARLQQEIQHMSPGPVQGRDAAFSTGGPAPAGNRPRFATEAAHQNLAAAQQMVREAQEQARLQQELQYMSPGPNQERDATVSSAGPAPAGNRPRFATEAAHQDLAAAQQMVREAQEQARLQQELQFMSSDPMPTRDTTVSTAGPPPAGPRPRFATQVLGQSAADAQWVLQQAQEQARLQQELQYMSSGPGAARDAVASMAGVSPVAGRPRFATQAQGDLAPLQRPPTQQAPEDSLLLEDTCEYEVIVPLQDFRAVASMSAGGLAAGQPNRPRFATQVHGDMTAAELAWQQEQMQGRASPSQELAYSGRAPSVSARGFTPLAVSRPRFATQAFPQGLTPLDTLMEEDELLRVSETHSHGQDQAQLQLNPTTGGYHLRSATRSSSEPPSPFAQPRFVSQSSNNSSLQSPRSPSPLGGPAQQSLGVIDMAAAVASRQMRSTTLESYSSEQMHQELLLLIRQQAPGQVRRGGRGRDAGWLTAAALLLSSDCHQFWSACLDNKPAA